MLRALAASFVLFAASLIGLAPVASAGSPLGCAAAIPGWSPVPLAERVAALWTQWTLAEVAWWTDFVFGPPAPDPGFPPVQETLTAPLDDPPPLPSAYFDAVICAVGSAGDPPPTIPDVVGATWPIVCPLLPGCDA